MGSPEFVGMDADTETLHLPLLSDDDEDTEWEDTYDAEDLRKRLKVLIQMDRMITISMIAYIAPMLYCIFFGVKLPVPFYYTGGVFGYPLSNVVIVFLMVGYAYTFFDWWRTRQVED